MSTKVTGEIHLVTPTKKPQKHSLFEDKVYEERCKNPLLPPLPPLQRAPSTQCNIPATLERLVPTSLTERACSTSMAERACYTSMAERACPPSASHEPNVTRTAVWLTERKYPAGKGLDGDGVSKLVLKNISKGTRKRALIHSIPKFSQVLPNQQLTEVQKVLQERLLKKRVDGGVKHTTYIDVNSSHQDRRASDLLQAMVDKSTTQQRPKVQQRPRRGRKPNKTEICHFKANIEDANIDAEIPQGNHQSQISISSHNTIEEVLDNQSSILPELTITRKYSPYPVKFPAKPYDFCTRSSLEQPQTDSNFTTELPTNSVPLVLKQEDLEKLAPNDPLYASYIFLPSVGVFVHPLAVPPELAPHNTHCSSS